MNKLILSIAVIAAIGFTSCKSQTENEAKSETKSEIVKDISMTDM